MNIYLERELFLILALLPPITLNKQQLESISILQWKQHHVGNTSHALERVHSFIHSKNT